MLLVGWDHGSRSMLRRPVKLFAALMNDQPAGGKTHLRPYWRKLS